MRLSIPALLISALLMQGLATKPAFGDSLTYSLDSSIGYGEATNQNQEADTCFPPNCVLFTGTLFDTDTDNSYLLIGTPYTNAADGSDFAGILSLANIFPTGILSGDPNWDTDGSGNPPNEYTGPIFGIDIPAGTPLGTYVDAVHLDILPTNGNNPFTISETVSVIVAPEPATGDLALAAIMGLGVFRAVTRRYRTKAKWHFSEP